MSRSSTKLRTQETEHPRDEVADAIAMFMVVMFGSVPFGIIVATIVNSPPPNTPDSMPFPFIVVIGVASGVLAAYIWWATLGPGSKR